MIDEPFARHLDSQSVDLIQFAFRWVNCLLIREVPFHCAVRLWDTYLAEGPHFADFLVYVCAALLLQYRDTLCGMDFQVCKMLGTGRQNLQRGALCHAGCWGIAYTVGIVPVEQVFRTTAWPARLSP